MPFQLCGEYFRGIPPVAAGILEVAASSARAKKLARLLRAGEEQSRRVCELDRLLNHAMSTNLGPDLLQTDQRTVYGFPLIGAVENMQIYYGNGFREVVDVFGLIGHDKRWREDFTRLRASGIQLVRYPLPWFRLEATPGIFDWTWLDGVLAFAREIGLEIIADPCHLKSFPLWLEGGFLNPRFPDLYLSYVQRLCDRYPWITKWTAFNEPLSSAIMWGRNASWCAEGNCDASFVRSLTHIVRGWSQVANWIRRDPRAVLIQAEPMEHHGAWPRGHEWWERESQELAEFHNARSFVATDLGLGRVTDQHPMWKFLCDNGLDRAEADWFQLNPAPVDILGWDYYAHTSEHFWQPGVRGWQRPGPRPAGMFETFKRYIQHYPGYNIMLSETNLPGRVEDRIIWLKYVLDETVRLQAWLQTTGRCEEFTGLCWFPSLDSHSWCHSEMAWVSDFDPIGIWWIDSRLQRNDSELSELWGLLARGQCGFEALPDYQFNADLARDLAGFESLLPARSFPAFHTDVDLYRRCAVAPQGRSVPRQEV